MDAFRTLLAGSQPLPKALWRYLLLGSLIAALAVSVVGAMVITAYPPLRIPTYVTGFFLIWSYVFVAAIGTWRSASRTETGRLRAVARVVVVMLASYFLLNVFQSNGVLAMIRGTWQPGTYLQEQMKQ